MTPEDTWTIVEAPFRPALARAYEGLFTLGSGYLHVRGSLEEHLSDCPQNLQYTRLPANVTSERFPETKVKWGTYVPGVFGRHPLLNLEMINLPHFIGIVPFVDDERLDVERGEVSDYSRRLRLRDATLVRTLHWRTQAGKTVELRFERFVSADRPHLCVQRLVVTPHDDIRLAIQSGIDADVRTNGHDHFTSVSCQPIAVDGVRCRILTDLGETVEIVSHLRGSTDWSVAESERAVGRATARPVSAGESVIFEKRTAVCTGRDLEASDPTALLQSASRATYDELHEAHAAVWRRRWSGCDVVIEGDDPSQLAVRVAVYHLLRAHVPNDPRVAIDPKGYAGDAYWGRFFWDTEMFLLPFFLYTDPDRARTLVDFRVQSLAGARANARRYGYAGARYAWESAPDGSECCPNWQYADHEVHVTADVVYGLVHYARAADNENYLRGPAAEVLVETARYWMQRLDWRDGDSGPSLLGVMGPDEYMPISSNNSFTNALVAFALRAAAEYGAAGGADQAELAAFAQAAASLPLPRADDDALVLQCEEFPRLADPSFDRLWRNRSRSFASQVSQERLYRSKCLKQADVIMLMMLDPDRFSEEEAKRAWTYYLPYTTHDSSLSAGVHAIVAARLGRDQEAWDFWQRGKAVDLDIDHGGAAEGIHIANAGAVWQMIIFGFAGMRTAMQADTLTLHPRLPAAWRRLTFPIVWKRTPVQISVTHTEVRIANRGAAPLAAGVVDEVRTIVPQEEEVWAHRR